MALALENYKISTNLPYDKSKTNQRAHRNLHLENALGYQPTENCYPVGLLRFFLSNTIVVGTFLFALESCQKVWFTHPETSKRTKCYPYSTGVSLILRLRLSYKLLGWCKK